MKKLLAIILAGLMVFSAVGVFAEESATTEETVTPNGYIGVEGTTGYSMDFDSMTTTPITNSYQHTYGVFRYRDNTYGEKYYKNSEATSTSSYRMPAGNELLTYDEKYNKLDTDKYFRMYLDNTMSFSYRSATGLEETDTTIYHNYPRFLSEVDSLGIVYNARTLDDSDNLQYAYKLNISFDIKNDDLYYEKRVRYQDNQNDYNSENGYQLFMMDTEGYMQFYNDGDFQIPYELEKWYTVDIVLDFYNMTTEFKIDGDIVYQGVIAKYASSYLKKLAFVINGTAEALGDGETSSMSIDNISVELEPGTANVEDTITIDQNTTGKMISSLTPSEGTVKYSTSYFADAYDALPTSSGTYNGLTCEADSTDGFKVYYPYGGQSKKCDFELSNDLAPFKTDAYDTYLKLYYPKEVKKVTVSGTETILVGPTFIYQLQISDLAQGEKLHISVDMRNDDLLFDKALVGCRYFKPLGGSRYVKFVDLKTDGNMNFLGSDVKLPYSTGVWYHFDVVMDYVSVTTDESGVVTGATGNIYYYVDGSLVATASDFDIYSVISHVNATTDDYNFIDYIGYVINTRESGDTTVARPADSVLAADDFSVTILPATATPSIKVPAVEYKVNSLNTSIPTTYTFGEAGTYTAKLLVKDTDPAKKTTFIVATYNSDNELTGVNASPSYDISAYPNLTIDVAATDTKIKVFYLNDTNSLTPYQGEVEIVAPAA